MKALVIVGPQGCGKSQAAAALLQRYGRTVLVDNWDGKSPLSPGALALTHVPVESSPELDVLPWERALAA